VARKRHKKVKPPTDEFHVNNITCYLSDSEMDLYQRAGGNPALFIRLRQRRDQLLNMRRGSAKGCKVGFVRYGILFERKKERESIVSNNDSTASRNGIALGEDGDVLRRGPYIGFALPLSSTAMLNQKLIGIKPKSRPNFLIYFLEKWREKDSSYFGSLLAKPGDLWITDIVLQPLIFVCSSDFTEIRCGYEQTDKSVRHLFSIRGGDRQESKEIKALRLMEVRAFIDVLGYELMSCSQWPSWKDQRCPMRDKRAKVG
jgi:hypothetical protein